jgi:hypothetical protein
VLERTGKAFVDASNRNDAAWDATIAFLGYKSFLNHLLPGDIFPAGSAVHIRTEYVAQAPAGRPIPIFSVPNIPVPKDQAARYDFIDEDRNQYKPMGFPFIYVDGGWATIDGLWLKHVLFRNVQIVYSGGQLRLEDVYFVNCTFDLARDSNSQRFALAILSPSTAVNFSPAT